MLKKTITYVDYEGVERTETHFFNLTKAELIKMNFSQAGGLEKRFEKMIEAKDGKGIMEALDEIIHRSYGEKSDDGRRFIKSEALVEAFEQTEAYSELFMELCTDAKAAADFVQGILPKDIPTENKSLPES